MFLATTTEYDEFGEFFNFKGAFTPGVLGTHTNIMLVI
jgi:hypothetical protein